MRDRFVRFAGLDAENASEEIVGEHTAPGVCFARFAEAVARLFDVALRVRLERLEELIVIWAMRLTASCEESPPEI